MAGLRKLGRVVKRGFTFFDSFYSKPRTNFVILRQESGRVESGQENSELVHGPLKLSNEEFTGSIKDVNIYRVAPVAPTVEKDPFPNRFFFSDLVLPKEKFSTARDVIFTSNHSMDLRKIVDVIKNTWDMDGMKRNFEVLLNFMDKARSRNNGEWDGETYLALYWLLQICENLKSPEVYVTALKFLDGSKFQLDRKTVMQFINFMAFCGWLDLAKRNMRIVMNRDINCNDVYLVNLALKFVLAGDAEFGIKLLAYFRRNTKKNMQSYYFLKKLLKIIVNGDLKEEWQDAVVITILDIFLELAGPIGWSFGQNKSVIDILQK